MHCAYLLRWTIMIKEVFGALNQSAIDGGDASLAKCKAFVVEIGTALSTYNSPNMASVYSIFTLAMLENGWRSKQPLTD